MTAAEQLRHYAEDHDAVKADPARWAAETTPIGETDDGEERLAWANCRVCGSTLAVSR